MAATLPIGHWSWHERWLYPDQIRDLPDRPTSYVENAARMQAARNRQTRSRVQPQQLQSPLRQSPPQQQPQLFHQVQQQPQSTQPQRMQPQTARVPARKQLQSSSHAAYINPHPATSRQHVTQKFEVQVPVHLVVDDQPQVAEAKEAECLETNPQAVENQRLPTLPRRYRDGTFRRTTSEYAHTYRDPVAVASDLGAPPPPPVAATARVPVAGSRLPNRERPEKRVHNNSHEDPEVTARVRPEQHSFRLWGRINNAHCVIPYETESQRAFAADALAQQDVRDPTHAIKVVAKEYKDALIKAKLVGVLR